MTPDKSESVDALHCFVYEDHAMVHVYIQTMRFEVIFLGLSHNL